MTIQFLYDRDQVQITQNKGGCEQKRAFSLAAFRTFLFREFYHLVVADHVGTVEVCGGLKWTFDWVNIFSKCVTLWIPVEEFLQSQNPLWMGTPAPKQSQLF